MRRNDLPEIKQGLQEQIEAVCARLLPQGRRVGREWVANNPHYDEARKAPALKVALTNNRGAWKDWRSGDKGDVIKLVEFCLSCSFAEALAWGRDFLGLEQMSYEERQAIKRSRETRAKQQAAESEKARLRKLARAGELWWLTTQASGTMTAAEIHARAYFAARSCPLEAVQHLNPESLRFAHATEWWKGAVYKRAQGSGFAEKTEDGPQFPAVHSAMRAASGAITCCHVTFLDPAKPAKAPVSPAKLMYGEASGAVIELGMGPEALPFWLAKVPHPLIIAEGIETALSVAIAVPECRVWAAGSLAGFAAAPVALPCVSEIHVARDNNHNNAQAHSQLAQALVRLEEAGKPLSVMESHVGDDFNDLIRGEE